MAQFGNVVSSKGRFNVVEMVEVYLDDTREVVGFVIVGPGVDSAWLYSTVEEALSAIDDIVKTSRPSSGLGM